MAVYGTSEGDIVSASFEVQRNGSAGQLTPNVQMKIINEAGENLGPNEIGEICYKTCSHRSWDILMILKKQMQH